MKLEKALNILAKFFAVDDEIFIKSLSKKSIIEWAQQIVDQTVNELGDNYKLTQPQHAFLIGEMVTF